MSGIAMVGRALQREGMTAFVFARTLIFRLIALAWLLWIVWFNTRWVFQTDRSEWFSFTLVPPDGDMLPIWWGNTVFALIIGAWLGSTVTGRMISPVAQLLPGFRRRLNASVYVTLAVCTVVTALRVEAMGWHAIATFCAMFVLAFCIALSIRLWIVSYEVFLLASALTIAGLIFPSWSLWLATRAPVPFAICCTVTAIALMGRELSRRRWDRSTDAALAEVAEETGAGDADQERWLQDTEGALGAYQKAIASATDVPGRVWQPSVSNQLWRLANRLKSWWAVAALGPAGRPIRMRTFLIATAGYAIVLLALRIAWGGGFDVLLFLMVPALIVGYFPVETLTLEAASRATRLEFAFASTLMRTAAIYLLFLIPILLTQWMVPVTNPTWFEREAPSLLLVFGTVFALIPLIHLVSGRHFRPAFVPSLKNEKILTLMVPVYLVGTATVYSGSWLERLHQSHGGSAVIAILGVAAIASWSMLYLLLKRHYLNADLVRA